MRFEYGYSIPGMFSLSFIEIIAIAVIVLIFVGPKQLPEVARTIARVLNELKRTTGEFTESIYEVRSEINKTVNATRDQIQKHIGIDEFKEEFEKNHRELEQTLAGEKKSRGPLADDEIFEDPPSAEKISDQEVHPSGNSSKKGGSTS